MRWHRKLSGIASDGSGADGDGGLDWLLLDGAPLGIFVGEISDGAEAGDGGPGGD